ncbi:hypothetical protein AB0I28_12195 [Phytomonospora sp. NPDC050363]|uniref:EF-hand domain-containing protein n=1 Tax=Phytomonospora sp. NPDC050363 TaxID=3155642 RepID=UPI003406CAEB
MDLLDRKFAVCFAHLDDDGSGAAERVDIDRIADRMLAAFPAAGQTEQAAYRDGLYRFWSAIVAECDADADGRVTRPEYIRGMRAVAADPSKIAAGFHAMGEATVRLLDVDGDGRIAPAEFAASVEVLGVRPDDAAETFALLDRDGDGHITVSELGTAIAEYYTSADPQAPGNYLFGRSFERVAA